MTFDHQMPQETGLSPSSTFMNGEFSSNPISLPQGGIIPEETAEGLQTPEVEERSSCQRAITPKHSDEEQVSVIRKEFVTLTGDHFSAVILNQLLYWTLRVKDFELYLEEEKSFGLNICAFSLHPESPEVPCHGWIYKTAHDLSEETMLGLSKTTMRKYLKLLIDQGWIEEKINAHDKWNKTTHYRVNIRKLEADLMGIGLKLPGVYLKAFSAALREKQPYRYLRAISSKANASSFQNHSKSEENWESIILPSMSNNLPSESKILSSRSRNLPSKSKILPSYTYTENTTKNTNREHATRARENENFLEEEKKELDESPSSTFPSVALFSPHLVAESMVKIWEKHLASAPYLTQKRREKLTSVLDAHFHGDLAKWDLFCQQLTLSPFLRGEGPRGWRVNLDWILEEGNLLKVLEGNFDDPHSLQLEETQKVSATHHRNISNILASIEDPVWRGWCGQFSEGIRLNETRYLVEPLRPSELEKIANARFLEFEDEKLFWVGSTDASVLKKIEDLRLTLSSYFTRKYPKFRMIRTRFIESSLESQETLVNQTNSPLSSETPLGETLSSETPSTFLTHSPTIERTQPCLTKSF